MVKALRRRFAVPFVVTIAMAPLAGADTAPNPPPPKKQPPGTNPPTVPVQRVTFERTWTVTKSRAKTAKATDCEAIQTNTCPKMKPGDPIPPCNPPAPTAYVCPTNAYGIGATFTEKSSLKVIQRVGSLATECVIDEPPLKCAPDEKCNPPAPKSIKCPT